MPVPSIITSAKAAAKAYRLRVSIESIKSRGSRRRGSVPGTARAMLLSSEDSGIVERIFRNESFVTDTGPALRHGVALRADRARRRPDRARRDAHPYPGKGHPAVRRALALRQALQAHHRQPGDLPGGEPLRGDRAWPGHAHRRVLGRGHRRGGVHQHHHPCVPAHRGVDRLHGLGRVGRGGRHPVRDRAADDPLAHRLCPRHGLPG